MLTFQTGGHDDERQYFAYVEVTEAGITVTAYQRSEAGDASKKNCSEYAAIDQFTVAKQTAAESAPEPAAPDAKLEKKGASPIVWVLIGVGAAAIVTTAVILILHKKKRGKAA